MADANWQHSHSNTLILPSSMSTETPCSYCLLQSNQPITPSRHDRWLKPRPNNMWQDVENQRFVDLPQYYDEFVDEDEYELSDENDTNNICNEIPGREEGNVSGIEDEAHQGPRLACSLSHTLEVTNEVRLGTGSSFDSQLPVSRNQQAPEQEIPNEILGPVQQEDDVITQFLEVMEDKDLHRDSIARLKSFFKLATLELLEQCSVAWTGSRILLEDRNFSAKTFRPYSRSLTPKQLYDALRRRVGRLHYSWFFLD